MSGEVIAHEFLGRGGFSHHIKEAGVCPICRLEAACAAKDEALRPFAEYHRERCRLHPNVSKTDSTIPVVSYGEARIGDKHFRAADAALSPSAGEGWVPPEVAEQAKRVLGELQWVKDGHCPWCSAHKAAGHDDDCGLAAALDALEKGE